MIVFFHYFNINMKNNNKKQVNNIAKYINKFKKY